MEMESLAGVSCLITTYGADFNAFELKCQIENKDANYRLHVLESFEGVYGSGLKLGFLNTGVGADVISWNKLFLILGA